MNYGLPYKGSKNRLAERIVRLLPKRTHLVDLLCGGCAVTHAALTFGKYEHIHINDLNWMCPTLFQDALSGKYADDTRWISRENFFRLKDTDPYVACVWSFGNNMRDYLYSRDIEPLKRALHYALFFSDYQPALDLGHDLRFLSGISGTQQRYSAIRHYFETIGGGAELRKWRTANDSSVSPRLQSLEARDRISQCFKKKKLQTSRTSAPIQQRTDCTDWHTTNVSSDCRCSNRGGYKSDLTSSSMDYALVPIPEDSVIYCDIPYEGTDTYNGAEAFDYERFYDWCEQQTEPVFISSYQMPPDRFDCIMEYSHRATVSATANNLVTECIFVPRHQRERGNIVRQLTLFDEDEFSE